MTTSELKGLEEKFLVFIFKVLMNVSQMHYHCVDMVGHKPHFHYQIKTST